MRIASTHATRKAGVADPDSAPPDSCITSRTISSTETSLRWIFAAETLPTEAPSTPVNPPAQAISLHRLRCFSMALSKRCKTVGRFQIACHPAEERSQIKRCSNGTRNYDTLPKYMASRSVTCSSSSPETSTSYPQGSGGNGPMDKKRFATSWPSSLSLLRSSEVVQRGGPKHFTCV